MNSAKKPPNDNMEEDTTIESDVGRGFERILQTTKDSIARKHKDMLTHIEKLNTEKSRLIENNDAYKQYAVRYYDMAYHLLCEVAIQSEVNQRLHSILEGALSYLPGEKQMDYVEGIDQMIKSAQQVEDVSRNSPKMVQLNENLAEAKKNAGGEHFMGKYLQEEGKGHPIDQLMAAMAMQDTAQGDLGFPEPEHPHHHSSIHDNPNSTPRQSLHPGAAGMIKAAPSELVPYKTLYHGEVVCAVALAKDDRTVYTGGKGCVKVWNITSPPQGYDGPLDTHTYDTPLAALDCMYDHYIRACKLMPDGGSLIVGGEAQELTLWDIAAPQPTMLGLLKSDAPACYALAVTAHGGGQSSNPLCISGCSDGVINIWDVRNQQLVNSFMGHRDGVSCVDVFKDGHSIVTGGLDHFVRVWDLRMYKQVDNVPFPSSVFSVGAGPDKWLAAGLENHEVRIFSAGRKETDQNFAISKHMGSVLSLKFASRSPWLLTTGKDSWINVFKVPQGTPVADYQESMSILCSDISAGDGFVVVGSGDQFSRVFQVR